MLISPKIPLWADFLGEPFQHFNGEDTLHFVVKKAIVHKIDS